MPICTNFAEVWLRIGNENKVFVSLSSEQAALTKKNGTEEERQETSAGNDTG